MPVMNFYLEDGKPPVTFTLRESDTVRFMAFMAECNRALNGRAAKPAVPAGLTDEQKTELLDWVSACQSAYHIENTPGHRFGGLGGQLQENREALVEYVESLLAAAPNEPT